MKTILNALTNGKEINVNGFTIYAYSDGAITVRAASSLMGPTEKATTAGLKRILEWIDAN